MKKLFFFVCLCCAFQLTIAQKVTSATVYFSSGKATLSKEAKNKIQELIKAIPQNVELQVEIYSFTDDIEKKNTRLELSQFRGDNVLTYLQQMGLPIKLSHLFDGAASNQEVPNRDENWRMRNRRTTIIISALVPIEEPFLAYEREVGVLPQSAAWKDPFTINGREYISNARPEKQEEPLVKPQ